MERFTSMAMCMDLVTLNRSQTKQTDMNMEKDFERRKRVDKGEEKIKGNWIKVMNCTHA